MFVVELRTLEHFANNNGELGGCKLYRLLLGTIGL